MGKDKNNKRKKDFGTKEVVFDPEARKSYLQGFSERKRQRRAYGLAMQKVKDRKAKLEQRAEMKKAEKEQIEEAEQRKEDILSGLLGGVGSDADESKQQDKPVKKQPKKVKPSNPNDSDKEEVEKVQTYQDAATQSHWGGSVIVTTSTVFPDEDSDNEEADKPRRPKSKIGGKKDAEQEYAGDVQRFMDKLKGKMPGKKKKDKLLKHRGNHGAANMKGMAGSGDMKIAQKALARSEAKSGARGKGKGGGGNKRRKGR